jgi:hypothetical protein
VAFSPDGHTLATASADRTARLWDSTNPRQPSPRSTLTGHTDAIFAVAFSPDGHALATASYDDTARLWKTNIDSVAARICSIAPLLPTVSAITTCLAARTSPCVHELREMRGPQDHQMLRRTAENVAHLRGHSAIRPLDGGNGRVFEPTESVNSHALSRSIPARFATALCSLSCGSREG